MRVRDEAALAAVAFAAAFAATHLRPALALPFLLGGVTAISLGTRAAWLRWDVIDRLLLDRDAYEIPAVRKWAERSASMKNRHRLAAVYRRITPEPAARACGLADDLEILARDLDDEKLELDPLAAVMCERLLSEGPACLAPASVVDTRACIRRVEAGFSPADA